MEPESRHIKFDLAEYAYGRALDIGGGSQGKVFPHMIGVDKGQPADVVSDAHALGFFVSESFDCVFSSLVLNQVEQPMDALIEWWRLVKVGGYLCLYLPNRDALPPSYSLVSFTPDSVVIMMERLGGSWDLVENQIRDQGEEHALFQVYRKLPNGAKNVYSWMDPKPAKRAAIMRPGAYGDALWSSSIAAHLKADGYHVTMMVGKAGEEVIRYDPNVDRIVIVDDVVTGQDVLQYWYWLSKKYDRFINLVGTVETDMLPNPNDPRFYWPDARRHSMMDRNYLEAIHDFAGVPHDFRQKFYPTRDEVLWAIRQRRTYDGPVVLLQPVGSSYPKYWPHASEFMQILADHGVHTVVIGDERGVVDPPDIYGHLIRKQWPIRKAMTFALAADVVVGTESVIVNSVAFEDVPKIVFMSHSSMENLTKHWKQTATVLPDGLACHPCHRIHMSWAFCPRDKETGAALCHSVADPKEIAQLVLGIIAKRMESANAGEAVGVA
jgi:ADP-heptose:LPS heptosyltransferase